MTGMSYYGNVNLRLLYRRGVILMEKFYEKKNFGIPVVILNILAYLIGYSLTKSLTSTLLIAVLFALVVFSLQFDDKVKNAVKHSYIFATYFILIHLAFEFISSFASIFTNGGVPNIYPFKDGYFGLGFIPRGLLFLYKYASIFVDIAVLVIFGLFILMTILKKDMNLYCVKKVLGEASPKHKNQAPTAQAPTAQGPTTQTPAAPYGQQPVQQQPVQKPGACPSCGNLNSDGAKFCGSCGTKIK